MSTCLHVYICACMPVFICACVQLESTIDFLKNQIVEKYLLINTLILRNANDSWQGIDGGVLSVCNHSYVAETALMKKQLLMCQIPIFPRTIHHMKPRV